MSPRLISFAGSSLLIEYTGARPAKIVDFLYRHIPANRAIPPHLTYRLFSADGADAIHLYRGQTVLYKGDSEAAAAELLLGDSCHHLADRSRGGLLFHAAGMAWQGQGLLLPGAMGAGKTTLAAWLLTKGFDYLTDELVFVPDGANTIQTFSRPLNLKQGARAVWQPLFDLTAAQSDCILSTPHSDLIPATLIRPANKLSRPPLKLVIFPDYKPGADFTWRPLSRAQAGLELMQCLINARNLPEHGFPEIARLARTVPAYKMSYDNFAQVAGRIEALLERRSQSQC